MTAEELQLWKRIEAFAFDLPDTVFSFPARLARENGWPGGYANRVVEEYRRFLFLCCVAEAGVTPSDPVDQAWHLHLIYTKSYWIDLCRDTIGREIHHHPTKGGKPEADKFDGYYTKTQKLYRQYFNMDPPADIWQPNKERFGDIRFERVNVGKFWLVPKPTRKAVTTMGLMCIFICIMSAFAVEDTNVAGILLFLGLGSATFLAVLNWGGGWKNGGNQHTSDTGCWSFGGGGDDHHGESGCSGCSGSGCSGCSGCGGD